MDEIRERILARYESLLESISQLEDGDPHDVVCAYEDIRELRVLWERYRELVGELEGFMKCGYCGAALPENGCSFIAYLKNKHGRNPVCMQCAKTQMKLDRSASLQLEKATPVED